MSTTQISFWLVCALGCVVAGWWLAVRPGATMRSIATPVSVLIIVLSVLLTLLAVTGQDARSLTAEVYSLTVGY